MRKAWFTRPSGRAAYLSAATLLVGLVFFSAQCDRENSLVSPGGKTGALVVEVAVPGSPAGRVAAAKATITQGHLVISGEGKTVKDTLLTVQEGWLWARVEGIPVGLQRVALDLQEGSGKVLWQSTAAVQVQAGVVAPVTLVLTRVGDTAPQVGFIAVPDTGKVGTPFSFQAQVGDEHDPTDSLQVRWDFESDGQYELGWTLEQRASHVFARVGTYAVALEARDQTGKSGSFTQGVWVVSLQAQTGRNAGADTLRARLGSGPIVLDGRASGVEGLEGQALVYHWSQVLGYPGAQEISVLGTLTDNHTVTAGRVLFEAKAGRGLYVFTLQVAVGGLQSDPDTLYVWVNSAQPVVSVANPDTVAVGQALTLQGQATDADGDVLKYRWRGEPVALLSDTTSLTPTFVAKEPGTYRLALVAIDADPQESAPAEVLVTVRPGNTPPVANAGPDQAVAVGATVQLDGSGSRDGEGDALSYQWTAPSEITLSSSTSVRPTFRANTAGPYHLSLVVNDGQVNSAPDEVVITVTQAGTADAQVTGEVKEDSTRAGTADAQVTGEVKEDSTQAGTADAQVTGEVKEDSTQVGTAEVQVTGEVKEDSTQVGTAEVQVTGEVKEDSTQAGTAEVQVTGEVKEGSENGGKADVQVTGEVKE